LKVFSLGSVYFHEIPNLHYMIPFDSWKNIALLAVRVRPAYKSAFLGRFALFFRVNLKNSSPKDDDGEVEAGGGMNIEWGSR
jgi:hypothetical protein